MERAAFRPPGTCSRLLAAEPRRRISDVTKAASADADAQQAWEAEIGRRIAAIESGGLALESWDDVKQRVAKDVLGR